MIAQVFGRYETARRISSKFGDKLFTVKNPNDTTLYVIADDAVDAAVAACAKWGITVELLSPTPGPTPS